MNSGFRHPKDIKKSESTDTLSVRIKQSTKAALSNAAEKEGYALSVLVTSILEDYVTWLGKQSLKGKR